MIKFFKKHKLKIFTAMFCAFAISLFTIISFSCKTYAYSIDNNGNLVGDNLYDFINNDCKYNVNNGVESSVPNIVNSNGTITIMCNANTSFEVGYKIPVVRNTDYTFSFDLITKDLFVSIYENGSRIASDIFRTLGRNSISFITQDNSYNEIILGFSTYEINVGQTLIGNLMFNYGTTAKDWEPYGLWYSQDNYNDLESRYNSLNTNINIFEGNILSQKIYINNIEQTYRDYDTLFKPLQRSLYINQDNEFRFVYQDYGENTYIRYELVLINEVSAPRVTGKIDLTDYANINMYDINDNNIMELYFNSMSGPLGDGVFEYTVHKNIKKIIIEIELDDTDEGRIGSVINFGNSYADGYLTGVNESNSYWETRFNVVNAKYNDLFNTNNSLNNQINDLNNSINSLKTLNANLQDQISNNVGWQSLFFAMADTPIRTVSNVLGFELFGLNLFSTFIGMVTVFAIVWLLKKFI